MTDVRLEPLNSDSAALGMLIAAGTEGSMPGPAAIESLAALHASGTPVWSIDVSGDIIGAVSIIRTPSGHATTVTYVRGGHHSPQLSARLKESARKACSTAGIEYVIMVDPGNTAAIASMAKVWPNATIETVDGGRLRYSTTQPVLDDDPEMVAAFLAALTG